MHHLDMEKIGDCLNMEDIFVELEGRVEKGPDFMLQLENNLSRLLVNEVFESELILLKGHLLSVIAIPEARIPPHNVHIPFPSNWNRSGPSEHSQKVIDIDCQRISLYCWPMQGRARGSLTQYSTERMPSPMDRPPGKGGVIAFGSGKPGPIKLSPGTDFTLNLLLKNPVNSTMSGLSLTSWTRSPAPRSLSNKAGNSTSENSSPITPLIFCLCCQVSRPGRPS